MLAATALLLGVGIATIYAAGHPLGTNEISNLAGAWQKQLLFAAIGLVGFLAINTVSYRKIGSVSYWLYGFTLLLLVLLLVGKYIPLSFVPRINGTYRWIRLHRSLPQIQPSELCKLVYIISLAWYLRYRSNYRSFKSLIGPFVLTVVPMGLILLEPDLGTVLLMMPILFLMLFVAGVKGRHLLIIILMGLAISPLMWLKMHSYQRIRISCVLLQNAKVRQLASDHAKFGELLIGKGKKFNQRQWQNRWGYQLNHSKYALAGGGLTGYGWRRGPALKYNFMLPFRHTDFIFALIAQQWGLLGCAGLLGLYAIIITCGLEIATHNKDPFGRLLAIGIVGMLTCQVLVNTAMTLGLMPITGLTLPLVSYGGSSLLVSMASVGLLNNIGRSRPFSVAPKA